MIRNFHGISRSTLYQEITALRDVVSNELWAAIDGLRQIGNIGAHMEKDINLVIDVDKSEAQLLINLIEMLFKDWYVARHDRGELLRKIVDAASDKKSDPGVGTNRPGAPPS